MVRDTKTAILDVAEELIRRIGPGALSYQHISDAVDIRKASVHYHFPTKEDLLEAVMRRYSEQGLALLDRILGEDGPADRKLARYLDSFADTFPNGMHDLACVTSMMAADYETLGRKTAGVVRRHYQKCEERLASLLEEGRRQGRFRRQGSARHVAGLILSFLQGSTLFVRAEGGRKRFIALQKQLLKMLSV